MMYLSFGENKMHWVFPNSFEKHSRPDEDSINTVLNIKFKKIFKLKEITSSSHNRQNRHHYC